MTNEEFENRYSAIREECERDGDRYFICHFSRIEDRARAGGNLNTNEARAIVMFMIERFGLSAEIIALMQKTP